MLVSAFARMNLPLLLALDSPLPGRTQALWSTVFFLASFGYTAFALGTRRRLFSPPLNLALVAAGFALQTAFLYVRGQVLGRCPLTNFFEVVGFLCWALVFFYLIVGNTYRLSPLGLLTAPLVGLLQIFAFTALPDRAGGHTPHDAVNPWLETHAAFSMLAFGAFALAGVAGSMYLWQERQLKSHRVHAIFFQLPPIADLGRLNARLLVVGLALLSVGLVAGAFMGVPNSAPHLVWAVVVWLPYAYLVQARWGAWRLGPRRVASWSVGAFGLSLLTLSGLSFVSV